MTTATILTTTNSTAHITWTGESDSYQLMYRAPEHKVRVGESFFEDFEGLVDGALPDGWTAVDADADGYNWYSYNVKADDELIDYNSNLRAFGTSCAISASWAGGSPLNPDNWLITPQLELRDVMSVWVRGYHPDYAAEKFAVYLSTTGTDISDFTIELIPETAAEDHFVEYLAYLGTYEGKKGYIAIRHFNVTDMYRLNVDNFGIFQGYETVPASDWVTIETTEPDVMLTGLDKNSTYEYKVIAKSQDEADQETSVMTFTTAGDAVDIAFDSHANNWSLITDGLFANVTINNLILKKDGKWQTICLPFEVDITTANNNVGTFYQIDEISENVVKVAEVIEDLAANTPYIVKPNDYTGSVAATLSSENISFPLTAANDIEDTDGKWTFKGAKAVTSFTDLTDGHVVYFFASTDQKDDEDNIEIYAGDFVQIDNANAKAAPFRAYLDYTGEGNLDIKSFAPGRNALAAANNLPKSMSVIIVNGDGTTTKIGTISVSGEDTRFTIDGIQLEGQPTEGGLYIRNGRAVMVK